MLKHLVGISVHFSEHSRSRENCRRRDLLKQNYVAAPVSKGLVWVRCVANPAKQYFMTITGSSDPPVLCLLTFLLPTHSK